jgi:ribokinase
VSVTAPAVETVDPTGAGDAFNGTLAAHLGVGAPLAVAMEQAVERASAACTHEGARPPAD